MVTAAHPRRPATGAAKKRSAGRPEAVKSRVGCYFTDVKLPAGGDKTADLLATTEFAQEATKARS